MWFFSSVFCLCYFHYVKTEFHLYMDNQTLCHQGIISLENLSLGRIYSHSNYHNQYFYFHDHHCSITIQTKKRIWLSIEDFQSNSSVAFPRCTEAKYAGRDDRLQILDGYKNGSILRIICGKDTDQRFDHTPLILKSSIFTIDWQTTSRSLGFQLKFVLYDRSIDGKCPNSSQFQCQNQRCIDQSLICENEDHCGDQSHLEQRSYQCLTRHSKQNFINRPVIFILLIFVTFFSLLIFICTWKICRKQNQNKDCVGGL